MAKEKEVVEATEVAVVNQSQEVSVESSFDVESDAGMGLENMSARDMSVPYFSIIQKTSPQVDKTEAEYIKGAEAGQFMNTVSQKLFDGESGVYVILCDYQVRFTEWRLREKGGGLVADHGDNEAVLVGTTKDEKKRDINAAGNQIVKSFNYPALIIDKDSLETSKVLISFTSTQLKKAKKLNTMVNELKLQGKNGKYTPPIFYRVYQFQTVPESNEQGSWYGFKITPDKVLPEFAGEDWKEVYQEAKHFSEQMRSGSVKAAGVNSVSPDDIPF